ncbi:lytic murein transglycosylase [Bathymodiolus septemdierum thioautotrophic gill symbiont]|uniref:Lytic murein transglycosylase n=1 Tax=endosymbiont of Bathymodiolus septemdierum str. Myojin knoll TaxID=1303921 RepID=A0A0P0UPZ9_9GAMM|nr:lytic murein transglycosylase [Bathymodiolus septemdierum thioautotrophic gill symbiont]BAS67084.1 lytic murein transglycosylase [endosymbiont of Bathymodiolus septemdierum str. Myojin knoll]
MFRFILVFTFAISACATATMGNTKINDTLHTENTQSFQQFLNTLRVTAMKKGVSSATLDRAFTGLTPDPRIIKYDRNQAEFTLNFWRYINSRVSDNRLQKGRIKLQENQELLNRVYKKYGVPPSVLVAFWGLETNYGRHVGKMNLVRSLATLSFDKRRRAFFTGELLVLLQLIDLGKLPLTVEGSWAGAMGNLQFMPSNVQAYAIDKDKDGKLDLWGGSKADIFYTGSNFLKNIGWRQGERWGEEVKVAKNFEFSLANLKTKKTVQAWQKLGVTRTDGQAFSNPSQMASLLLPMGYQGPAFLVYRNFRTILRWNRSILYALSVGHLADRIMGKSALIALPIAEPSLRREDIQAIQTKLNTLGFDTGKPDGIPGPKTRGAVRAYQQENGLPVDGYVGYQLLQKL